MANVGRGYWDRKERKGKLRNEDPIPKRLPASSAGTDRPSVLNEGSFQLKEPLGPAMCVGCPNLGSLVCEITTNMERMQEQHGDLGVVHDAPLNIVAVPHNAPRLNSDLQQSVTEHEGLVEIHAEYVDRCEESDYPGLQEYKGEQVCGAD